MHYQLKTPSHVSRIATNIAWEIKYWADILGCSEVELVPAVKAMVNPGAAKKNTNVATHLKRRHK